MSLTDIIKRTWQENILFSVLIELTYSCNQNCFFCYNDRKLKGKSLSPEQYFQLLQDLHDFHVLNLTLSGGEPLQHPQFWDIGRKSRELGFVLRIKSNGYLLSRTVCARLKKELDPFCLELSLHGASPATHDRQTRVQGSFVRLMRNITGMKKEGLRVQLNCALTIFNEHEIRPMYKLADDLDIKLLIDPQITPRDDGDTRPQSVAASDDGLRDLYKIQTERGIVFRQQGCTGEGHPVEREKLKHCGAGSSTLTIDPYGNVYPCVAYRRLLGNLHKQTVKEIWSDSEELAKVRRITMRAGELVENQGPLAYSMGFCPGHAATTCGDPMKIYPAAYRILKLRNEVTSRN